MATTFHHQYLIDREQFAQLHDWRSNAVRLFQEQGELGALAYLRLKGFSTIGAVVWLKRQIAK
jgi:hypothetical protein